MTEEQASAAAVIATTADIMFWIGQNMTDGFVNAADLIQLLMAMREDAGAYL